MKSSKYIFMSHSSMFVSIAGSGHLCLEIFGWIKA